MSAGGAAYLALHASGELEARARKAHQMLRACTCCARFCAKDRLAGELGSCGTGARAIVSSFHLHFGEEEPLVGVGGSGTIFFSRCNLACVFCQNFEISQLGEGLEVDDEQIAAMMLRLQRAGAHNVNLVSPSHVVPQLLAALCVACAAGLRLPLVYNTGGYDSVETLRLLDGVVDIYMPDAKYADADTARRLSGVPGYPEANRAAIREMHRQVGDLEVDDRGVAVRGLIVRHLVLPDGLAGTEGVCQSLANEISTRTYLNVMDQYRPCWRASEVPELRRAITRREWREAVETAESFGLGARG
jgi:putative pyruvate formate lyase activating enzyme